MAYSTYTNVHVILTETAQRKLHDLNVPIQCYTYTSAFRDAASGLSTSVRSIRTRQARRGAITVLVGVSGTLETLSACTVRTRWTRVYNHHQLTYYLGVSTITPTAYVTEHQIEQSSSWRRQDPSLDPRLGFPTASRNSKIGHQNKHLESKARKILKKSIVIDCFLSMDLSLY